MLEPGDIIENGGCVYTVCSKAFNDKLASHSFVVPNVHSYCMWLYESRYHEGIYAAAIRHDHVPNTQVMQAGETEWKKIA